MTIDLADVVAAVVLGLFGNGLLGSYLLQRSQTKSDGKLERLKAELERKVRTLQTALDRTIFVHRAQFDTEFSAMRDIWAKVVAVRGTMVALRPSGSTAPIGETPEQSLARFFARRKVFSGALGELKDAVYNNSPFIPEPLYQELFDNLLMAASAEHLSVQVHTPDENNWYETGERNLGDVMNSVDSVSRMIRERIRHLALVPREQES